ncbi:LPS assembly lipoprotein LptE [Sphaerotilus mobilis]|uniref:LPS-assembly lipoprotein LptE n=1 Tax=Sphaerotilus mobilis TaxID=47994 RepID=A0A4Q7LBV5_9BURK|nr:LPS assembly lipoprotein LptE [Sphaerotilus mobilis]RZS46911.1 LPS-assembly lipoprotein [Sphaerotilus mobilis]
MNTRRACLTGIAGLAGVALAGCGFQLRRPPELTLKRVHLAGFGHDSALADELRRQLRMSPGASLAATPVASDLVLESVLDQSLPVVATLTAAGQVRELTLRASFTFRVRRPDGAELIAPTALMQSREMSYAENDALAKAHEQQFLVRTMHQDMARQVLRRLAALTADTPATSAAPAAPAVPASAPR